MELDPIIKDLGASVIALRPQETCSCTTNHTHLRYRHMGLLVVLVLVLVLAFQKTFIWPAIIPQLLTIMVSAPLINNKEKISK